MSTILKWAGFSISALFFAAGAHAQISVDEPWVRATVAQQSGTGAFMKLTSASGSALVKAESPAAKHVEIHEMAMENHVMKMREIPKLDLPAGKTVELKPGGYHIMFFELNEQMREGQHVPITLTFEDADGKRSTQDIRASVRPLSASSADGHGHSHGHGHGGAAGHAAPKH